MNPNDDQPRILPDATARPEDMLKAAAPSAPPAADRKSVV